MDNMSCLYYKHQIIIIDSLFEPNNNLEIVNQ